MYKIVKKIMQMICIVLLFASIKCDILFLENSFDERLLENNVSCTASCIRKNVTSVLSSCYRICNRSNSTIALKKTYSKGTIQLICREDDSLTVKVSKVSTTGNNEFENTEENNQRNIFLIKMQANISETKQQLVYIADSSIVRMDNLQENTNYTVFASIFIGNFEYRQLSHVESFKTLEDDKYIPKTISNNTIKLSYSSRNDSETLLTTILWGAAEDKICNYHLHLYDPRDEDYFTPYEQNLKQLKPIELYHFETDMLKFETEYILEIHGTNAKNARVEGEKCTFEFTTPTCWQFHGFNLQKCRPLPLANIHSTHEMVQNASYRINVTWDSPKYLPDFYDVTLNLLPNKGYHIKSQNVSGTQNYAFFPEVIITGDNYDVHVVAISKGGHTSNNIVDFSLKRGHTNYGIIIGILSSFVVLLSISCAFVVIQNRPIKIKQKMEIFSKEIYVRQMTQSYKRDKMEIETDNVELHEILGEGAFGIVRRGILKPNNTSIAVKMLKENAGIEDIKAFLSEIALMKSVGHHGNIVGIVGHSTIFFDKLMLLTEYCSNGNLLDYLRKFRENFSTEQVYSTSQKDVMTFESFERSPGDIFQYDSKVIDSFTLKEKSISLSTYGQNRTKNILETNDRQGKYSEPNMHNIIFNRLYKVNSNCERKCSCNIPCENETEIMRKANDCPEVLLIAENQGYDLLTSPDDCMMSKGSEEKKYTRTNDQFSYLTGRDLLVFAKQIATGMEFLVNNKIVHRDLAARNVLVCNDKTVKIADFGLSRDIYVDNIYTKSSGGRVPIKWLALESMTDHKYTSQSDVWSYGILLYEIVTLGGTPYPTVPVDCLVNYLKSGNRMSKPHNCSPEFNDLMFSCWQCEPGERPTFTEIVGLIDWFIHQSETNEVLRLDKLEKSEWTDEPFKVKNTCSSTSYLKPF